MKTTAADILIDTIYDWGVEVVFGLPGDGINGIMESLRKRADKIRFIQVRHEEAAAFMACAYAKYTGKLGVLWSAKTRSDPAWIGMTFTLQSFAAGIHDEDRRVSASPKLDDSAECNAACTAAPPSESSRLEFRVRGLSGDVSGYSELSIAS